MRFDSIYQHLPLAGDLDKPWREELPRCGVSNFGCHNVDTVIRRLRVSEPVDLRVRYDVLEASREDQDPVVADSGSLRPFPATYNGDELTWNTRRALG